MDTIFWVLALPAFILLSVLLRAAAFLMHPDVRQPTNIVSKKNRHYSPSALKEMEENNINKDLVEQVLCNGKKTINRQGYKFQYTINKNQIILVYTDKPGNVLKVFT